MIGICFVSEKWSWVQRVHLVPEMLRVLAALPTHLPFCATFAVDVPVGFSLPGLLAGKEVQSSLFTFSQFGLSRDTTRPLAFTWRLNLVR